MDSVDYLPSSVADVAHRKAGESVDILLAVNVGDYAAASFDEDSGTARLCQLARLSVEDPEMLKRTVSESPNVIVSSI